MGKMTDEQKNGDALAALRELSAERAGTAQPPAWPLNAHIHLPPNFSAFSSVREAVGQAREEGLSVLGAHNYYDFTVYREFAAQSGAAGIFPLFSTEIIALDPELQAQGVRLNDPGNPGKVYLCGKGIARFEALPEAGRAILQRIRQGDDQRMAAMVERLARWFAERGLETGLDADRIEEKVAERGGCARATVTLQERHLAEAFQDRLYELLPSGERAARLGELFGREMTKEAGDNVAMQNTLRSALMKTGRPCYVEEGFVTPEEAYLLVRALGGIVCYPILADGVEPQCEFERDVETLIEALRARGIHMVEFIPNRNAPELLEAWACTLRGEEFVVTAGTEHNTLAKIALEPGCKGGAAVPSAAREIFREGACVVAAHQHRVARGEEGYVDAQGRLDGAFADGAARIAAYREWGAAVIEEFANR